MVSESVPKGIDLFASHHLSSLVGSTLLRACRRRALAAISAALPHRSTDRKSRTSGILRNNGQNALAAAEIRGDPMAGIVDLVRRPRIDHALGIRAQGTFIVHSSIGPVPRQDKFRCSV